MKHNKNAYPKGYDACFLGRIHATTDGVVRKDTLPCRCSHCLRRYDIGFEQGLSELFSDALPLPAVGSPIVHMH